MTDASGVPTNPDLIPTYNTSADAPSGLGFNTAMAQLQAIITNLKAGTLASGKIAAAGIVPGTNGQVFQTTGGVSVWGAAPGLGLPLALTGATAATRYVGATASGAPVSGTFAVGDFIIDQAGKVWVCTVAGSPGTWVAIGGSSTTTRFTAEPARMYSVGNGTTGAANTAWGLLFYLPQGVSITNFYHSVIVTGGNYDFGIYDLSFNAIWRYGTHAVPAASTTTPITVAVSSGSPVTSPLVLNPGWYYLVSASDSVTPQFATFVPTGASVSANRGGVQGVAALDAKPIFFSKAASFPLPASIATPTAWDYFSTPGGIIMVEGV